ncbi:GpE family phage tail protein [Acinetobacter parvus]|uniref:GpE family phage tail protein n=1 Tax=Acinetobacter parvus TaxID=134533 RepID=UPI002934BB1F|nr:GpE family phage tail protein [Acinetobacter parvus]
MARSLGNDGTLPASVDEVIANIAVVFGWTPNDCAEFEIEELIQWEQRALKRHQTE